MHTDLQNYYQLLELNPLASLAEIKASWRKLAKRHHPDRNQGDEFAGKRFALLNEAYQTLSDSTRRRDYDRKHRRVFAQSYRTASQAATESASSRKAGNPQNTGTGSRPRTAAVRGRNVERQILIPMNRLRGGGSFRISLEHLHKRLTLELPDPVVPGATMVFPGYGQPGRHGGAAGKLVLKLQPDLPENCFLEGRDLHIMLQTDTLRAALGYWLKLKHPDGRMFELNLPAGSQDGCLIRLRGKGLPLGTSDGDLVCHLQLITPAILDSKSRRLAQKLIDRLNLENPPDRTSGT